MSGRPAGEGEPTTGEGPPEEVRFGSGGDEVAGSLWRPGAGAPGSAEPPAATPAVVLAPGFGATRIARLGAYAERFRDAGFLVLVFDYRHFGASGGRPRQLLSIRRQVEDWHAALAFVRGLPGVDADRVALWGTSFSGGHVVRVAAEDGRVAAVVSQIPFMDGLATVLRLHPVSAAKATVVSALDLAGSLLGRRPLMMPIVDRPGRAAAMAMHEAMTGFERLFDGAPFDNRVCGRIGLATLFYRPLRWASRVPCPLLVQAGERDTLTPPGPARRAVRAAPLAEFTPYEAGHFDFYFGEVFERAVAEQVDFLQRHLLRTKRTLKTPIPTRVGRGGDRGAPPRAGG